MVDDPELPEVERDLLTALGEHAAVSAPIVRGTDVWGELYVEARTSLHEMAYRDPLTGLANRRAVDDELEQAFAEPDLDRSLTVILCDVNDLKGVNDTFGHAAGDLLLRDVGRLLSLAASELPACVAARIGGDEFCLLSRGRPTTRCRRPSTG